MSMRPVALGEIPEETARVAKAAFLKGSLAIRVGDELGTLSPTSSSPTCFRPGAGQPGRLTLVPVLQFVEGLTDRQAAEAV